LTGETALLAARLGSSDLLVAGVLVLAPDRTGFVASVFEEIAARFEKRLAVLLVARLAGLGILLFVEFTPSVIMTFLIGDSSTDCSTCSGPSPFVSA
jgi:hypothetical protein